MRGAWVVVVLSACFHPSYDRPTCGPGDACPSGLTCRAKVCEPPGSGPGGGSDASVGARVDAADDGATSRSCWALDSALFDLPLSACPPALADHVDIASDLSFDTSTGVSTGS